MARSHARRDSLNVPESQSANTADQAAQHSYLGSWLASDEQMKELQIAMRREVDRENARGTAIAMPPTSAGSEAFRVAVLRRRQQIANVARRADPDKLVGVSDEDVLNFLYCGVT